MVEKLIINSDGNPAEVDSEATTNFGASGTNPLNLSQGALAALGGSGNVQAAVELAQSLMPKKEKFDPAMAALLYFTKMGELASKPGATLLGSASGAAASPAAYLMQQSKDERDRKSKLAPLAVQLATTLDKKGNVAKKAYTNTNTGATEYYTPREFNSLESTSNLVPYAKPPAPRLKTVGSGTLAKYFATTEDAEEFVVGQGLPKSSPNFASTVAKFVAPSEGMVGQTMTDSGIFLEVVPLARGADVINLQLTPSKTAAAPRFQLWVEKRIPLIAKATDIYSTTAREVIPRVEEAMTLLRSGTVETGGLSEKLLPFKQVFNQAFGIKDSGVMAQETLQATSNYLAPKMRAVGSGSTSDMEFKAYQRSILSLGNTPKANYISLYAFKKMAQNGVSLNQKEMELLTSDRINSAAQVNAELNKIDEGIFEKYTGPRDDPEEFNKWYGNLEEGAVIINNNLFSNDSSPYVIKGWGQ